MPVLEAHPDETQVMRYKLVTLPKSTTKMPLLSIGLTSVKLGKEGDEATIQPKTRYFEADTYGYTAILTNSNYANLEINQAVDSSVSPIIPTFLRDDDLNRSIVRVGRSFTLISKDVTSYSTNYVACNLIIVGNDTGATRTIPVYVYRDRIYKTGSPGLELVG